MSDHDESSSNEPCSATYRRLDGESRCELAQGHEGGHRDSADTGTYWWLWHDVADADVPFPRVRLADTAQPTRQDIHAALLVLAGSATSSLDNIGTHVVNVLKKVDAYTNAQRRDADAWNEGFKAAMSWMDQWEEWSFTTSKPRPRNPYREMRP